MSLVSGLLTHICTVKSPVFGTDKRGGQTTTLVDVVVGQPVLINQTSERQNPVTGGKINVGTHQGFMDSDAILVVKRGMIITDFARYDDPTNVETEEDGTPTQYRIINPQDPNNLGDHLELALERIVGRGAIPSATP